MKVQLFWSVRKHLYLTFFVPNGTPIGVTFFHARLTKPKKLDEGTTFFGQFEKKLYLCIRVLRKNNFIN